MNYLKFYNGGVRKMQVGGKWTFEDMLAGKAGMSAYMDAKKLDLKQNGQLINEDPNILTMDLLMQKYASPSPMQDSKNPAWSATLYADLFGQSLQQYQKFPEQNTDNATTQLQMPFVPEASLDETLRVKFSSLDMDSREEFNALVKNGMDPSAALNLMITNLAQDINQFNTNAAYNHAIQNGMSQEEAAKIADDPTAAAKYIEENNISTDSTGRTRDELVAEYNAQKTGFNAADNSGSKYSDLRDRFEQAMSSKGAKLGLTAGVAALNVVDLATMGDKNFGSLSLNIDGAVHAASGALMASGNPYAMAAGAGIEALNFLTKATGQTTEGFDVDIKSSGYGQLGHYESKSNRDFGALFGLGGLNQNKIDRQIEKRNLAAQMALKAANVSDTIAYEQEARMNSVDDTIQKNEIALQGGVDTSLLAAKHGAKLIQKEQPEVVIDVEAEVEEEIVSAKNGAKLEKVEVSDEKSVIPEGAMHKNKNNLNLGTTEKGIPVITTENEIKEGTRQEIEKEGGDITLHAEVEASEIIFSKELTDYVEDSRKKWKESDKKDNDLLLEVGKRIVKEIMTNTDDNTDLIPKIEEQL